MEKFGAAAARSLTLFKVCSRRSSNTSKLVELFLHILSSAHFECSMHECEILKRPVYMSDSSRLKRKRVLP